MKRIWATWRMKYILSDKHSGCVFCAALQAHDDAAHHILLRGDKAVLLLNLYPYTNGHLMVVPYAHTGDIASLDAATLTSMMQLVQTGVRALRQAMSPHGFNVGLNLGQAAGAGIQDHLHIHVVPRWDNDTNFMPVLGDVRVIPEALDDTYHKLRAVLTGPESKA
jgi:ATP adenylyltransferase